MSVIFQLLVKNIMLHYLMIKVVWLPKRKGKKVAAIFVIISQGLAAGDRIKQSRTLIVTKL